MTNPSIAILKESRGRTSDQAPNTNLGLQKWTPLLPRSSFLHPFKRNAGLPGTSKGSFGPAHRKQPTNLDQFHLLPRQLHQRRGFCNHWTIPKTISRGVTWRRSTHRIQSKGNKNVTNEKIYFKEPGRMSLTALNISTILPSRINSQRGESHGN